MPTPRKPRRKLRTVLLVLLATVLALVGGTAAWRAIASRPAGEPQAVEFTDATVSSTLTSATVLALGEATHGTAEFHRARQQLLEKVADKGFTTIALEEDAGNATLVDAWLQGGPGTVEEAAGHFGYKIYRTREMANLLSWIRTYNEGVPADRRVRLYGVDVQRPSADKQVALDWLTTVDADAAASFEQRLSAWTDDSYRDKTTAAAAAPVAAELVTAVEKAAAKAAKKAGKNDDKALRARLSAQALAKAATYIDGTKSADRDQMMADQLAWLVEQRGAAGSAHTLLFAHNGHVDRAGQAKAAPGTTLGQLAAQRWGERYRVIGTDGHHVGLRSQDAIVRVSVASPIRGLFTGTKVGYLEVAQASPTNKRVLERSLPMVSAGEPFPGWYAWVPTLSQVQVTTTQAWDALIYVENASPVTPIG